MNVSRLLISGLIYLVFFTGTIALFALVEKGKVYRNSAVNQICKGGILAVAILLPCLLAGIRGNSVGVDVEVYVAPHMRAAVACSSFAEVYDAINGSLEYLYVLLVFIASRITEDEGLLLFLLQFFAILPIVLAIVKMKSKVSLPLAIAVYLFVYYNNSLNMMRQSVSCGFVLLGTVYLVQKKGKSSIGMVVSFLIALLFHKSGWIGIVLVIGLYWLMHSKLKKIVKTGVVIAILCFPILGLAIYEFMVNKGILTGNFLVYGDIFLYRTIQKDWFVNPLSPNILAYIVLSGALVGVSYAFAPKGHLTVEKTEYQYLRFLVLVGFLMNLVILFSMQTLYGQRITMYLDMFIILLLPMSIGKPNIKLKRNIAYLLVLIYWIVWIMRLGWSGSNYLVFRF